MGFLHSIQLFYLYLRDGGKGWRGETKSETQIRERDEKIAKLAQELKKIRKEKSK